MSKIKDLRNYKKEKDGVYTVEKILKNVQETFEKVGIEELVVTMKTPDGTVTTGWSDIENTKAIGLLEISKQEILKDMWVEY